jgi:hypothetical protein
VELAHPDLSAHAAGRRRIVAASLVVVLAAAGGATWLGSRSSSTTPAGATTAVPVTGRVVTTGGVTSITGTSPVEPIRSAPMQVRGYTGSGRRIVRRFAAGRDGRFALVLPPGTYTFTAVIYQGAIPLSQEPHETARVRPGQHPRVHITQTVL